MLLIEASPRCQPKKNHSSNCCIAAVSLRRLVALLFRLLARVDLGGVALHSSSAYGKHLALGQVLT